MRNGNVQTYQPCSRQAPWPLFLLLSFLFPGPVHLTSAQSILSSFLSAGATAHACVFLCFQPNVTPRRAPKLQSHRREREWGPARGLENRQTVTMTKHTSVNAGGGQQRGVATQRRSCRFPSSPTLCSPFPPLSPPPPTKLTIEPKVTANALHYTRVSPVNQTDHAAAAAAAGGVGTLRLLKRWKSLLTAGERMPLLRPDRGAAMTAAVSSLSTASAGSLRRYTATRGSGYDMWMGCVSVC